MEQTTMALLESLITRPFSFDKIEAAHKNGYMTIALPAHEEARDFLVRTDVNHSLTIVISGTPGDGDRMVVKMRRASEERIMMKLPAGIYLDGELKSEPFEVEYPAYAEEYEMDWFWTGSAWAIVSHNAVWRVVWDQKAEIGDLSQLETEEKSSLVAALNEEAQKIIAETARAVGAEQANTAAIKAEAQRAAAAEAANAAALGVVDEKVVLNDEITAAVLANLNGRIAAIEESIKTGFAGLVVDNLSVKVGMKAYMFNGETDDDALVVVRAYAPNFIPKCYAQRWFDTVAKKWYKPTGLTSISDWVVDN